MTSFSATAFPVPLLASLIFAYTLGSATAEEATRPPVEVNLEGLGASGPALRLPTRVIDGETVIILVPPALQQKKPAQKIVTPRVKPSLTLPETATAKIPTPPPSPSATADEKPAAEDIEAKTAAAVPIAPEPKQEQSPPGETEKDNPLVEAEKIAERIIATPPPSRDSMTETGTADETATNETEATAPAKPVEETPDTSASEEMKVASVPDATEREGSAAPAAGAAADKLTRLLFAEGGAELSGDAQATLQAMARQITGGARDNVQLLAYGSGANASAARRLSLGRALAVRSKLMELGVDNKQIEVRALGAPQGDGPPDRVDLLLITR